MLHVDVWWRGQNVLVDGGSFRYNGAPEWHNHFMRTRSHNTVEVDGRDQMLHLRKFKVVYWTRASRLRFLDETRWSLVEGEHYGYTRHPGRCVHRRSLVRLGDSLWVVVDRVSGGGPHGARLQWLAGAFPHEYRRARRAPAASDARRPVQRHRDGRSRPCHGRQRRVRRSRAATRLAVALLRGKDSRSLDGRRASRAAAPRVRVGVVGRSIRSVGEGLAVDHHDGARGGTELQLKDGVVAPQ